MLRHGTLARGMLAAGLIAAATAAAPAARTERTERTDQWAQCRPEGSLQTVAGLREASGLAASRTVPGRFWTHNDSGQPVVYGIDARGAVTTNVRLTGATVEDWEAIAVGPCNGGSCLYVGDIGDNKATRKQITVYRVQEPSGSGQGAAAEPLHATYPDGAHDAETLLATSDGGLYIVTKGETGPIGLYRFPQNRKSGGSTQLERVGAPRAAGKGDADRITDGAVSPDGAWIVLRTKTALMFYAAKDILAGPWREASRVDLRALKEPQGEGVAFGANGTIYLAGEGTGAGSLARISCGAAR